MGRRNGMVKSCEQSTEKNRFEKVGRLSFVQIATLFEPIFFSPLLTTLDHMPFRPILIISPIWIFAIHMAAANNIHDLLMSPCIRPGLLIRVLRKHYRIITRYGLLMTWKSNYINRIQISTCNWMSLNIVQYGQDTYYILNFLCQLCWPQLACCKCTRIYFTTAVRAT